jgi:menaquinone-dependent protoporphyrinogen oxidase
MPMVVLVGYATAHGSTQGTAKHIRDRLQERGVAADVRPMSEVEDLGHYDAAVLGSAIHGGKWLPPARQFVDRNMAGLRERPVWLFSVSTLGDEESMFPPKVARRLRALRKETLELAGFRTAIAPREHRNFAGSIARSYWPASGRVFFRAMGGHYGDFRNWAAIERWADCIAAELLLAAAAQDLSRRHPLE